MDESAAWERSYENLDNFLFYPNEEVIRFVSKRLRKQIGLSEYRDVRVFDGVPKWLDLGCGIGRHVILGQQLGFEVYGIDLSAVAVDFARQWARTCGVADPEQRILQGDISTLPWPNNYFDAIISHGVLDSMPYETAQKAVREVCRVLKDDGVFYCDFIGSSDTLDDAELPGEMAVEGPQETGTVQSYFNMAKIKRLIEGSLDIADWVLVRRDNVRGTDESARFHLTLRKCRSAAAA